jgi:hypothetical protein
MTQLYICLLLCNVMSITQELCRRHPIMWQVYFNHISSQFSLVTNLLIIPLGLNCINNRLPNGCVDYTDTRQLRWMTLTADGHFPRYKSMNGSHYHTESMRNSVKSTCPRISNSQ